MVVFLFSCVTFAAALSRADRGRLPPLWSPLDRYIGCGASSRPALTDPARGLPGRGGLQRHPPMIPENRHKSNQNQQWYLMFHTATMIKHDLAHAGALLFYLSSDSAGEPPHGFIGGVVFTSTPHLKGKRHSVSFNLKRDTK